MTIRTNRTKWQTEIGVGNIYLSLSNQLYAGPSDGQTLASAISFCHFVRMVQSVIWSDQMNRFVHLKFSDLCWDSIQFWSDGWTLPSAISFCHFVRIVQSVITDCTIRHLVWPNESICSFCHLEKFWIVLRQLTIGQMDWHCHPLFHFVISYGLYNPSFGLTNWIDLFILSFGKISDLCWDSIQLVRWMDIAIHYFSLSFRTDCTIRHLVWPTESICSFCHLEKFLICAETAYNWSDGQTLPSAISFCHFVRMVQSVIWSDQLNRFVHFVIWKNFWFYAETAYNWSDGQTLPSAISFCHFVRIVQSVIWSDQLNRFVHFVIWKNFWFVLIQHTIGQMDGHCHPLFHFVISYGLYNPSFGLTNWIDLFILSFGKISDLCWDSIQLVRWMDIAIHYFSLSFRTDCTIRHLAWPTESICSFCHLEKFLIRAETAYNWSDGQTLPSPISVCHFVRYIYIN